MGVCVHSTGRCLPWATRGVTAIPTPEALISSPMNASKGYSCRPNPNPDTGTGVAVARIRTLQPLSATDHRNPTPTRVIPPASRIHSRAPETTRAMLQGPDQSRRAKCGTNLVHPLDPPADIGSALSPVIFPQEGECANSQ